MLTETLDKLHTSRGYYPGIQVPEWILIVNGLNGKCSKLCNTCKRTWQEIGTGGVYIRENERFGRRDCDMAHVFDCEECHKTKEL
jgi:hypothetical protein